MGLASAIILLGILAVGFTTVLVSEIETFLNRVGN